MAGIKLIQGDCLEKMAALPAGSVDMILCDLPYGTTACSWDAVIPFDALWAAYRRVLRKGGVVVLTAAQPFTTAVIGSNLSEFKYCWYWDKKAVTGFANAKLQPLRCVEDVVVFYDSRPIYNPQGLIRLGKTRANSATVGGDTVRTDTAASAGKGSLRTAGKEYVQEFTNYPKQLIEFSRDRDKLHPTQKPVALMEYLIKTYTNPGDTVLDNCMGSGTTGVACVNLNRSFIGIERDPEYFRIASERINATRPAVIDFATAAARLAAIQARINSALKAAA